MATEATNDPTPSAQINGENAKILADGLFQLLQPIVLECDTRMNSVFKSQHLLADQIDELTKGIFIHEKELFNRKISLLLKSVRNYSN